MYVFAGIAILDLSAFTSFHSSDWKISENYSVKFDGGDPSVEYKGLQGTISFDYCSHFNNIASRHTVP